MAIVYRNHSNPDDMLLVLYYAIITMAFILVVILTSVCRVSLPFCQYVCKYEEKMLNSQEGVKPTTLASLLD